MVARRSARGSIHQGGATSREEDGSEGKANTTDTEEESEKLHAIEPPFRPFPSTVSFVKHLAELLITQDHGPILRSKRNVQHLLRQMASLAG